MYSRGRGGLGVESLTLKREVRVRYLPCRVVSLSKDAFTPQKVLVNPGSGGTVLSDMKDIVEWDVKHLNTKKQAFGAFKAVRHRMVENYLGIEQCSFCADAHAVRGVLFNLGQRVKTVIQK